jgi:2,4-dienoyl-CoA reductase-like NADH-dependent reductase (Old Yellow Enzyme family)
VSVKLNSADFQRDGVSTEEAEETALSLAESGVDLLEISGGTFEAPAMLGAGHGPHRIGRREAYFLDFAERVRSQTAVPLMLTGGFRTPNAMADAVNCGAVDVVGLARPLIWSPGLPAELLSGSHLPADKPVLSPAGPGRLGLLADAADIAWHRRNAATGHGPPAIPAEAGPRPGSVHPPRRLRLRCPATHPVERRCTQR